MEPNGDDIRKAAWTSYWATGGLHSCVGSFDGNYTGAIGEFWAGIFDGLKPRQRVLDLATGNGALPLMLFEQRAGDVRIDAVDLAKLSPPWYRPDVHTGVAFHAGVAMEALPFETGRFDLVVSQYGFEYADRDRALQECLRVLAHDGGLALVLHHAGSVLVEVGHAELRNQNLLLSDDGLIATARAVIPWFAKARAGADLRGHAEATACRENYNAAMQVLARQADASRAPDVLTETRDQIHALLPRTGSDPTAVLAALDDCRKRLEQAQVRTAELVEHALDEPAAADLVEKIIRARPGMSVSCEPIRQREGILGWALWMRPSQSVG